MYIFNENTYEIYYVYVFIKGILQIFNRVRKIFSWRVPKTLSKKNSQEASRSKATFRVSPSRYLPE